MMTIDNIIVCKDYDGNKKYVIGAYDDCYEDCLADYCGHFYTWLKHYDIGDRHKYRSSRDFWDEFFHGDVPDNPEYEASYLDDYCFVPVYAVIHGGIYLTTTDPKVDFDSGRAGFIYCSKDEYNKYFLDKDAPDWKDKYYQYANGILEEYNDIYSGQTYGFIVSDAEEIDSVKDSVNKLYPSAFQNCLRRAVMDHEESSCYGFHGDYESLLEEFIRDEHLTIVEVL